MKKIICILIFISLKNLVVAQLNNAFLDSTKNYTKSSIAPINFPISFVRPNFVKLPNYYLANLGLLCKAELNLQKQTFIPIKFRLGSQQVADFQEGKNNIQWQYTPIDFSKFW